MKNLLRKWLGLVDLTKAVNTLRVQILDATKSTDDLKDDIINDLEYEIERKVEDTVDDQISNYSDRFDDLDSIRYDFDDFKADFEQKIDSLKEDVEFLSILNRLEALESKVK